MLNLGGLTASSCHQAASDTRSKVQFSIHANRAKRSIKGRESKSVNRSPTYSADVIRVAQRLRGSKVLLVGGDQRPDKLERIERAFELEELIWLPTSPHTSIERITPHIKRHAVAVVLLALRWASHVYSPHMRKACNDASVPFVRLRAGLNPNRIANEIVAQIGEQLRVA